MRCIQHTHGCLNIIILVIVGERNYFYYERKQKINKYVVEGLKIIAISHII